MFNELINCTELLHEEFEGRQISEGFNQYIQLAEFIADSYDDSLTTAELLDQHPWLEAMTEAEQYGLLKQAKRIRKRNGKSEPAETPLDKKIRLEKAVQAELDRRTKVEKLAVQAISRCDFDTANGLLAMLDDGKLRRLLDGFAEAGKEKEHETSAFGGWPRGDVQEA